MIRTKEHGITLVALVVTIIILIILAGVSINMVLGENGIITRAIDAKFISVQNAVKEEIEMYRLAKKMENIQGIEQYPVLENETLESVDKNSIPNELKEKMMKWASTAENGEIPSIDKIDYSKFYKVNKEKVKSAKSFNSELYLIMLGDEYKVICIPGEKYQGNKITVMVPLNDIPEPEYIAIGSNTYKLYGDGKLSVLGKLTQNSGMTTEESNSINGLQKIDWNILKKETDIAFDANVVTDDEIAKKHGLKKIYLHTGTIYVIDAADELWAWGNNDYNKLGQGHTFLITEPTKILEGRTEGENNIKAKNVWAGATHTYVLDTNGRLWACGNNTRGALGQGNTDYYDKFVQISISGVDFNGIKKIESEKITMYNTTMIIMQNGDVYVAGENSHGSLGTHDTKNCYNFVKVSDIEPILKNAKDIKHSGLTTIILTQTGEVYGLGYNYNKNLVDSEQQYLSQPAKMAENVESIFIESINHQSYVTKTGEIKQYYRGTTTKMNISSDINAKFIRYNLVYSNGKLYSFPTGNEIYKQLSGIEYIENNTGMDVFLSNGEVYIRDFPNITKPRALSIYRLKHIFDNAIFVHGKGKNINIVDKNGNIYENINTQNTQLKNVKKLVSSTEARFAVTNDGYLYAKGSSITGMWGDVIAKTEYEKITLDGSNPINHVKEIFTSSTNSEGGYSASNIILTEEGKLYWAGSSAVTALPNISNDAEIIYPGLGKITRYLKDVNSTKLNEIKREGIKDIQHIYMNNGGIQGGVTFILTNNGNLYTYAMGTSMKNLTGLNKSPMTDFEQLVVKEGTKVKEIKVTEGMAMAILDSGELYAWGYNIAGLFGDGYEIGSVYPTPVKLNIDGVEKITIGQEFAIIKKYNGEVYGIGNNDYGQLGTENNTGATTFVRAPELEKIIKKVAENLRFLTI